MVQTEELIQMKRETINGAEPESRCNTTVGAAAPERMDSLLSQVKNPYCMRVGETSVRITFHPEHRSLHEILRRYFLSLKRHGYDENTV